MQGDAGTNEDRKSRVKLRPQNVYSTSLLFWQLLYLVEYISLFAWNFSVTTFLSFCFTDRFEAKQVWDNKKTEIICKTCNMITEYSPMHDDETNVICRWLFQVFAILRIATLQFGKLVNNKLLIVKVSNPLSRFFGPQCNVTLFQEALRFHGHYKIQPQLHCSTHKSVE